MTGRLILAHDFGTTGNKATLFSVSGELLASCFAPYDTKYPHTNWAEQNPHDWWRACISSTRQLLELTRVDPQSIACVSFSGQMMGCLPVDRSGHPLRTSIIWADQRATCESDLLLEKLGNEKVYAITGHRISPAYSCAKILWIRRNQPDLFRDTFKFLHAKDYIVLKLTGRFVTDYSDATGMNLFDIRGRRWSETILDAVQLDESLLPEALPSTTVAGQVTREASQETGLMMGTLVVIGAGDGIAAAVGAGIVKEGIAYNYVGSSSWISVATRAPIFDPKLRTFNWAHAVPNMVTPCGTMQSAGASFSWFKDILFKGIDVVHGKNGNPFEQMNQAASQVPAGAEGLLYLPYLMGERSPHWNPHARACFIGLTLRHSYQHMVRATIEGVLLNLRTILTAIEEAGQPITSVRVIGGGAQSSLWREIMASIYQKPIAKPKYDEEATSIGAAIIGGVGVGAFPDFAVVDSLLPMEQVTDPDPRMVERYDEIYPVFMQAYDALLPVFDALAQRSE